MPGFVSVEFFGLRGQLGNSVPESFPNQTKTETRGKSALAFSSNRRFTLNQYNWKIETDAWGDRNLGILHYSKQGQNSPNFVLTPDGRVGIGDQFPSDARLHVNGTTRTTVLQITSARDAKRDFERVDVTAVLEKVAALPLAIWAYTNNPGIGHVGPVTEDFHAAFALGDSAQHIATVDADGVALAAIQGLNHKLEEVVKQRDAEITRLSNQLNSLRELLEFLKRRLGTVESDVVKVGSPNTGNTDGQLPNSQ